jgi:hypothetical protein
MGSTDSESNNGSAIESRRSFLKAASSCVGAALFSTKALFVFVKCKIIFCVMGMYVTLQEEL